MLKPACLSAHASCCMRGFIEVAAAYCTTYLREVEQKQSRRRFAQTVEEAREALCAMLNQLYAYRRAAGITAEEAAFYLHCTRLLETVIEEIAFCWSKHCADCCGITDEYLDEIRPVMRKELELCKRVVYNSNISQALALTVITPAGNFIAIKDARLITLHDVNYMQQLLQQLQLLAAEERLTEDELVNLLLCENYNHPSFIEYCYDSLKTKLQQQSGVPGKIQLLEGLMERWDKYLLTPKPGLLKNETGVVFLLLGWVLYQWACMRKTTDKGRAGKLVYTEDPPVVGALFQKMHESGFIEGSLTAIMEHIAENAEFPNTKTPSVEYLMKAYKLYPKEVSDTLLHHYLPLWAQPAVQDKRKKKR